GGVIPAHLHNRIIILAVDVAGGTLRMTPVGADRPRPPVGHVAQINRVIWRREDQLTRLEHLIRWLGSARRKLLLKLFPIDRLLGRRYVSRGIDKLAELRVGDVGL